MTDKFLYVNAAKGIQSFILQTNKYKLKEMIGGSEIIESLPIQILPRVLQELGLQHNNDYTLVMNAAGGSCLIFKKEAKARELALIWPILCDLLAPGLEMVQTVVAIAGNDLAAALNRAEKNLRTSRNIPKASLPPSSPLVRICYRTGLAASAVFKDEPVDKDKPVDQLTFRKLKSYSRKSTGLLRKIYSTPDILKENGLRSIKKNQWLHDLNETGTEGSYLALIHADANSLGSLRMRLNTHLASLPLDKAVQSMRNFSVAVETATLSALRQALRPILRDAEEQAQTAGNEVLYPVRPIVCAGDDLTIILSAGPALTFARDYLTFFEQTSKDIFNSLNIKDLPSNGLTACAGITYIKRKFPFSAAYELCEHLCSFTKKAVNRQSSAVSFFRITTSSIQDYSHIYEYDLTTDDAILTMAPYGINNIGATGERTIDNLLDLAHTMRRLPNGSFRELLSCMLQGKNFAVPAFRRLCDVGIKEDVSRLQTSLTRLTDNTSEYIYTNSAPKSRTPVFDALELLRVHDFS